MPRRKTTPTAHDIDDTVIAAGMHIRGDITSQSDIWIDGTVEGDITTSTTVILGQNGEVNGNINGRSITVHGTVNGDVTAENKLAYEDTAYMQGSSYAPTLQVANGAIVIGEIRMPDEKRETGSPNEDTSESPE